MGAFWDSLSKNIKTGLEVSQKKIEEYSHIGKLKLDISFAKRNKGRLSRDLGEKVYRMIWHDKNTEIANDDSIQVLMEKINAQEKIIADLEALLAEAIEKQKQAGRK